MLKKSERLRKDRDITLVYRKGRRLHSPHFSASYLFRQATESRVAFVVSKAISKRAVVRNRLRRRLSEIVKRSPGSVGVTYDMVMSAKKGAEALSFQAVKEEVARLLTRIPASRASSAAPKTSQVKRV